MPVYNPGNVDTGMKIWWPSSGNHYHMPNAYSDKVNGSSLRKQDKENNNH